MTTTRRRPAWLALPVGLALVAALAWSPALAQDGTPADAAATPEASAPPAWARARAFAHRLPDGARARLAERFDGRGGPFAERRGLAPDRDPGAAFTRWLAADLPAGPVVPGLVGTVPEGTTVRLTFYAGAPDADGTELADLVYVAGTTDAAAFREQVRAAAEGADHVVVDVIGRVVALPQADAAE